MVSYLYCVCMRGPTTRDVAVYILTSLCKAAATLVKKVRRESLLHPLAFPTALWRVTGVSVPNRKRNALRLRQQVLRSETKNLMIGVIKFDDRHTNSV